MEQNFIDGRGACQSFTSPILKEEETKNGDPYFLKEGVATDNHMP